MHSMRLMYQEKRERVKTQRRLKESSHYFLIKRSLLLFSIMMAALSLSQADSGDEPQQT